MPQTREDRYHGGMRCEQRIEAGVMAFPCTLPRDHDGPCYAMESAKSRYVRDQWEKEQEVKGESEPTHENCTIGHAHEGPCSPVSQEVLTVRADSHPEGGYFVTLPDGQKVHLTAKDLAERPSGVIGVQDSLRALVEREHGRLETSVDEGERDLVTEPPLESVDHLARRLDPDLPTVFVPTKTREGDQRLPDVREDAPDVQSMVIADIEKRRQVGISRYRTALQTFNGRNTAQDLYEELLDAAIYLRSLLEMRESTSANLIDIVAKELASMPMVNPDDPAHRHQAAQIVHKIIDSIVMKVMRTEDSDG